MARQKFNNQVYDTSNISGAKLAEIGRVLLDMPRYMVQREDSPYHAREGDYTDIGWLDSRIDEICRKGKI